MGHLTCRDILRRFPCSIICFFETKLRLHFISPSWKIHISISMTLWVDFKVSFRYLEALSSNGYSFNLILHILIGVEKSGPEGILGYCKPLTLNSAAIHSLSYLTSHHRRWMPGTWQNPKLMPSEFVYSMREDISNATWSLPSEKYPNLSIIGGLFC